MRKAVPRLHPSAPSRPILIVTATVLSGGPGPGAWAYVVCLPSGLEREGSDVVTETTANRLELTALIRALESLAPGDRKNPMRVVSASQYVVYGAKSVGERKTNLDLWERLNGLTKELRVAWEWEPQGTMAYQDQARELAAQALSRMN